MRMNTLKSLNIILNTIMKYAFTLFVSLSFTFFFVSTALGQSVKKDSVTEESVDRYKVVTNGFFDDWFIGAGIGTQFYYGDHNRQMKFTDRLVPAYELYLAKWFTPGIGVRTAVNGLKNKGVTQNHSHSTGEVFDSSQRLEKQEFNYLNIHGDVLFNLTYIINGYNKDRIFTMSPYLGVGWMFTSDEPAAREISANIGLYNSFRVSNTMDITFDLRGSMVSDRFDGEVGERKEEGMFTAALGLAYRLGKKPRKVERLTWTKPVTTVVRYTEEELNELKVLQMKVAQSAANNETLRQQLSIAKNESITDINIERNVLVSPILITFPINESIVSDEARVNLGFFANAIKENQSGIVYKITGYADKATGNAQINEHLSQERATAIYNVLINEFGVSPSSLRVEYEGGVDNMFYDDPRLSRAVIVLGE